MEYEFKVDELPLDVLDEISGNPAFETIFVTCAADKKIVDGFNKIYSANIRFNLAARSVISAMIDRATGFNGSVYEKWEITNFIYFVYKAVYLPMLDEFNKFDVQSQ